MVGNNFFRKKTLFLILPSVLFSLWGILLSADPEITGYVLGMASRFAILVLIFDFVITKLTTLGTRIKGGKNELSVTLQRMCFVVAVLLAFGTEVITQSYLNMLAYLIGAITLHVWKFYEPMEKKAIV